MSRSDALPTKLLPAVRRLEEGDLARAIAGFSAHVDDPEVAMCALGYRAWSHRAAGDYASAIADYERALKLGDDAETQFRLGETLLLAGRARDAASRAVELLRENALDARAARLLRHSHMALGIFERDAPWRPNNLRHDRPPAPSETIEMLERSRSTYPNSACPEIGRVLYTLVRCIRPRIAVETGCYIGYSTVCIGQALRENVYGHLHSFDLFLPLTDYESPVAGRCATALEAARGHVEHAGLAEYVTLHQGDSSAGIREYFDREGGQVDFAFIDGDHTIKGAIRDWDAIDPVLAPGALVLMHDTAKDRSGWVGPGFLMEQIRRGNSNYGLVQLPTPEGCGLALLQKVAVAGNDDVPWRIPWSELLFDRVWNEYQARRKARRGRR